MSAKNLDSKGRTAKADFVLEPSDFGYLPKKKS